MRKLEPSYNTASGFEFRSMASVQKIAPEAMPNERCGDTAFQPLFGTDSTDGRKGGGQEQAIQIEQASCRGMQSGLESGRKEACRVARNGLSPSLKSFVLTLNDLSLANQQMKAQVSAKVIELALSISERVMGESARLSPEALNDLKSHLEEALSQLNRITLQLNPSDIQAIEALLADDGTKWPSFPQIEIESDTLVPPGEMRVADRVVPRTSVDASVLSALGALLSKNNSPTA
jgi:flagellar biosynthesis/type III secretory pathway protein FliH